MPLAAGLAWPGHNDGDHFGGDRDDNLNDRDDDDEDTDVGADGETCYII